MALRLFACMKPAFLVSKQHRTAWVSVLLRGQIHILTSATLQQAGVGVFHEFVRLTAQTKQALTVTMLLSVSNFPEWLQAVANLSIQALRPGSAVPFNSRYYLLELWRRVAHEKHTSPWGTLTDTPAKQFDSPATAQIGTNTIPTGPSSPLGSNPIPSPSMAGPPPASAAGHQTPAKSDIDRAQAELHRFLDGFGPRLIAAVVQSRLALLTPASGRLLPVAQAEQAMAEPDWSEELKTFPFIARLCLHSTYTLLSSQLEACLALHRRETSLSPRASPPSSSSSSSSSSSTTPSSAPSDGLATITSIELRIAVLLYFAAAAVGTDKFHTDPYHPANTLPANTRAWPQDIEAGLCALCFCCLTPLTRPLRAHHQSGLQPFALGTRPAFPSLPRQAELAVLFWFQQLQAKYLGNTSPYEQCTTRPSSLFADRKAKVAGIWKRVSEVNCSAGGVVGPTLDEQEVLNRVVERLLQNLAGKTEFPGQFTETAGAVEVDDEVLDASLALFESLSSEYLTGRQVCNLPCVKALLTAGPGLNLRFSALVRADSLKHKSRLTTLYHILAMLLFRWQHTKSQPFAPNTVPPVCPSDALWLSFTKFIRCFEPSFHKLQRGTATAVDASTLFRQLRGLLQGANDSPPYLLIHQALFPDAWPVFSDTLRRFHCSSPVVISFLRFLSELVHNTSRRVDFGKNSPQGLIMVRKVADMLTEIILSLHRASAERVPCQDLYRERLKPLALSLEVLHRCWTGGYVNFGIFTLYEDKCVDKLTKSILSLLPLPSGISAPSAKGRENLSLLCTPTGPDGKARANASSHSFLNGLLGHPKLRRLLFTWLNTCTGQHLGCIIDTDPEVFQQLLMAFYLSVPAASHGLLLVSMSFLIPFTEVFQQLLMAFYLGLQTQDSPHQTGKVSSLAQVCTCLDHLLSFFHQLQHKKQLMESQEGETDQAQGQGTALATGEQGGLLGSANYLSEEEQRQWAQLQAHLVRGGGERLLQQIFNTLFDLALFTDHPNLWLLADPLLCLLVIQPSVLPTYQKALEQADQTSQLLSARLSSALGKLTKGVGRNLEKDNKSRFYDNLTALINSLNTHAIPRCEVSDLDLPHCEGLFDSNYMPVSFLVVYNATPNGGERCCTLDRNEFCLMTIRNSLKLRGYRDHTS
eukprot:g20860.t1